MKTFILILALLSLFSCSEDETFCYECTVSGETNDSFNRCDITESEARRIENNGTILTTPYRTSYIVGYQKKTVCLKKG